MMFRAAAVLAISLALPALAQRNMAHGGLSGHNGSPAHVGSMGHAGSIGHGVYSGQRAPGYSGIVGINRPSSFSPPGRFPLPGRLQPPARNGMSVPFSGHVFAEGRYPNRPHYPNRYPHRDPYHDRHGGDRHHGGHHHSYGYAYTYPGLYGYTYPYPYVINPGFYDWGAPYDSEDDQSASTYAPGDQAGGYSAESPYPGYDAVPYTQQQEPAPGATHPQVQEYHFADSSAAPSQTNEPLKVVFKDNRAPVTMQNYMINSTSLTDLDRNHYQQIPLDEIDVAATQQANRAHGILFQVPSASHE